MGMCTYARTHAYAHVITYTRTHSSTHTHRVAVDEDALPILDGELRVLRQQVQFAAAAKLRRRALVPAASAYTDTYITCICMYYMYMYVCTCLVYIYVMEFFFC